MSQEDQYRCRCLIEGVLAGYIPDNSGTQLKVIAAALWAVQEAALEGSVSPIEAYSCGLHVLDAVQGSQKVACMTSEDWHQSQEADPVLSLVIARLQDGTLGKGQSEATDPPKVNQSVPSIAQTRCPVQMAQAQRDEETLLQLVLPAVQREIALRGCHDKVGHLGLECMLNLMHDRFFWPHMVAQAKEHIGKCHLCLAFKARHPKAPTKTLWPHIL